ncbi:uncharacterized protein EDB91DRAFT_1083418 [Suillus paluster]|uniref:uncharacterized protein n=1 Tax=Suillus paluster TaxID=48578 RepID=UPI001B8600F0|nr:uncharacterized protein EDB91DRAFT_1083418 [Suillus paluster]KAG1736465.1 hypothetical protein EDB91DRAFT_1083418 [Suillus paluster]
MQVRRCLEIHSWRQPQLIETLHHLSVEPEQFDHYVEDGFVVVKNGFMDEEAAYDVSQQQDHLGRRDYIYAMVQENVSTFAPKVESKLLSDMLSSPTPDRQYFPGMSYDEHKRLPGHVLKFRCQEREGPSNLAKIRSAGGCRCPSEKGSTRFVHGMSQAGLEPKGRRKRELLTIQVTNLDR